VYLQTTLPSEAHAAEGIVLLKKQKFIKEKSLIYLGGMIRPTVFKRERITMKLLILIVIQSIIH
jgi:hypothetical protein